MWPGLHSLVTEVETGAQPGPARESVQGVEGRVGASTPRLPAGPLPPTCNTGPGPESLVQLLG